MSLHVGPQLIDSLVGRITVREVQLKWNPDSVVNSDIGLITEVATKFEVVAHLEVTKTGVRQLVSIAFKENMGSDELNEVPYLDVEGPLNPYPIPGKGETGYVVVWNKHPLSVAAINFDSLHVIPPYIIGSDGVQITIRGLPEGVSGFLKAARAMLPPDNVNVVEKIANCEYPSELCNNKRLQIQTVIFTNNPFAPLRV